MTELLLCNNSGRRNRRLRFPAKEDQPQYFFRSVVTPICSAGESGGLSREPNHPLLVMPLLSFHPARQELKWNDLLSAIGVMYRPFRVLCRINRTMKNREVSSRKATDVLHDGRLRSRFRQLPLDCLPYNGARSKFPAKYSWSILG